MRKFRPILIFALLTATFGFFGCGSDEDSNALRVQLSWIKNAEFAGEYFADTNGCYEEEGFSSVTLLSGPKTVPDVVMSRAALVGLADVVGISPALSAGVPLKIIDAKYQKNPFTILSLKAAANIRRPADLIGKRIGV